MLENVPVDMTRSNDNKRAVLITLGCKLNQFETFAMEGLLTEAGYKIVDKDKACDLIIINTCTVTAKSDFHCRQAIRKMQRNNPNAFILVTGCYAQRDAEALLKIKGVDAVIGNPQKADLLKYLHGHPKKQPFSEVTTEFRTDSLAMNNSLASFSGYTRAFIRIQDGCDDSCSYCIVPSVRGSSRSVPAESIIQTALRVIEAGYKELVLTGVHIGRYGLDLRPPSSLYELVKELISLPGLGRLRFTSIEPTEIDQALLKLMAGSEKICKHLHIPMQSADDDILRSMNRPYDFERYKELIYMIKELMPHAGIGADVIVGFPGEDDGSFELTYNRIKHLPLSYLHVFSYSDRPGVKASSMPNKIPKETIAKRSKRMRKLGTELKRKFREDRLGEVLSCLVLSKPDKKSGLLRCLSDNYIEILAPGGLEMANKMVPVRLERLEDGISYGRIE